MSSLTHMGCLQGGLHAGRIGGDPLAAAAEGAALAAVDGFNLKGATPAMRYVRTHACTLLCLCVLLAGSRRACGRCTAVVLRSGVGALTGRLHRAQAHFHVSVLSAAVCGCHTRGPLHLLTWPVQLLLWSLHLLTPLAGPSVTWCITRCSSTCPRSTSSRHRPSWCVGAGLPSRAVFAEHHTMDLSSHR